MQALAAAVQAAVEGSAFSGAIRVDRAGRTELSVAYGLADRALAVPNTVETRFGIASGTKGLTAVAVMKLVEQGALRLDTTARSLLGKDLPLVADDVTVEHLLAHRSGIGDYFDEEVFTDITDYVMPVPVHELATTEAYLSVLDGHPTAFAADQRFAYNNSGYVVLALLAERATGECFPDLVRRLVCEPAGMLDTAFLRGDGLPGRAAKGYLHAEGLRTNALHLPVVGSGDGGAWSTVADFSAFWAAFFGGRILSPEQVAEMVRPRSDWPEEHKRFGLGFHLDQATDEVWLEGSDAGVSFLSLHQPSTAITFTVASNWSEGAWPIVRVIARQLGL